MNNDIRTTTATEDFLCIDKQIADVILEGQSKGIFSRTLEKMPTIEVRERLHKLNSKTFHTQQVSALIDVYNEELALRSGHPNDKVSEEIKNEPYMQSIGRQRRIDNAFYDIRI
jgi:hypothetical protein